jgi:hypothetical protein
MQISSLDQIEGTPKSPTSAIPIYNFDNETNTFVCAFRKNQGNQNQTSAIPIYNVCHEKKCKSPIQKEASSKVP